MAYMNQDKKQKIKAALDPIMKQYGIKYSLSVRNHSTIVCTIKSSAIDFIGNVQEFAKALHGSAYTPVWDNGYVDVNVYHYDKHFSGLALEVITKIMDALSIDNYDNSDSQTDYFDVGHYIDLHIGAWDKPYVLVNDKVAA